MTTESVGGGESWGGRAGAETNAGGGRHNPRIVRLMKHEVEFSSTLFKIEGKGGWTFAPVPEHLAPPVTDGWGRTPVEATVDGRAWKTSVWRERSGRTLLPVPKDVRAGREHGDVVQVSLRFGLV